MERLFKVTSPRGSWSLLAATCLALVLIFTVSGQVFADSPDSSVAPTAGPQIFRAVLSSVHEVPMVDSAASGQAILALSEDGTTLHYRVMVDNVSNIGAAHIHTAPSGSNGPVEQWLYDASGTNGPDGLFDPSHPISGTLAVTSTQVSALMAGNYYVNIHTSDSPAGALRGQIKPYTSPTNYNALMAGSREVPPVASDGAGITLFTLGMTNTLTYEISVTDIVSITAAHIHRGAVDEAGPVVEWLYDSSGTNAPGGPLDANNSISGTITLDAAAMVDLLTGYLYVNAHTPSSPPGEIRGQIGGARLYRADLSAANEVPAVDSAASGQAIMALSADGSALYYRVLVNEVDGIAAAHIHRGKPGGSGPVEEWIYDASGTNGPDGTFDSKTPISGMVVVTETHLFDLARGNYYINIHSADSPSGELRGQLQPYNASGAMNVLMAGANEVPVVDSEASGYGRLYLNSSLNTLHYQLNVESIADIKAAHIHVGPPGENGPVKQWLYDASGANAMGGDFDPGNPIARSLTLTAEDLVDLLTGYQYVNIHTAANSGGEIRGQIGGARLYRAELSGTNEVPPTTTAATGEAILALSADTTSLHYRIQVSDIISITAAHIHSAQPGMNGPVAHWIYDASGMKASGGTFGPGDPISGTIELTGTHLVDLAKGNYYINIHTAAMSGGEIRGQVEKYDGSGPLTAALTGANEVPAVMTDASGQARFYFNSMLNSLLYRLDVSNVNSAIKAAHIHNGPAGSNGPVLYWLYDPSGAKAPSGPLDNDNPVAGHLKLDGWAMVDLLTKQFYVNVHTADVGSGEIRGQIGRGVRDSRKVLLPIILSETTIP